MDQHCPNCGPSELECIATNEHRCEDGRPTVFTCLNCLTCWNAAGQIISRPQVEPEEGNFPGGLPVAPD